MILGVGCGNSGFSRNCYLIKFAHRERDFLNWKLKKWKICEEISLSGWRGYFDGCFRNLFECHHWFKIDLNLVYFNQVLTVVLPINLIDLLKDLPLPPFQSGLFEWLFFFYHSFLHESGNHNFFWKKFWFFAIKIFCNYIK